MGLRATKSWPKMRTGAPNDVSSPAPLVLGIVRGSPEEFGSFVRAEFDKWAKVIKSVGIRFK